jgi:hypothetical protein
MNSSDKSKLKHDFLNSIVIISVLAKSASNFINKISDPTEKTTINPNQMEKFLYSMNTIQEQTKKLEHYFRILLGE